MRTLLRTIVAGATLGLVGLGVAPATASSATASSTAAVSGKAGDAHSYRHGVIAPRGAQGVTPAIASASNLAYNGGTDGIGVTTGAEKVYLVFWGSQWGTAGTDSAGNTTLSGDPNGAAPYLQRLYQGLGTDSELWSGTLTQYCEGVATGSQACPGNSSHVAYPTGGALAGVWEDSSAAAPASATASQISAEAVAAAAHFGNTAPAANRDAQYVIVSPTGTHPDGFNAGAGFCAWHSWTSSAYGDLAYHNLPYVSDMGGSCGQNAVNSGTAGTLDGFSIVDGHEYAETVTDQNPSGGWTDSGGSEIADKCAWRSVGSVGGMADLSLASGTFAMQGNWDNDSAACAFTHPIVVNGTGTGNTVTVTNPGLQSTPVGTPVNQQFSATDSASGQTLTYSARGLPSGLSMSSTGLVTGVVPLDAGEGYDTVRVTALDSAGYGGSATFTWEYTRPASAMTGVGGLCLDARNGASTDGTAVQVYGCNSTAAQQWTAHEATPAFSVLGKCLQASGSGTVAGTPLVLWDCDNSAAEVFLPESNGTLLNPVSGLCATDPGGSLTQGTQLQLAACTASAGQVWSTPPAPAYATITWNETASVGSGQTVYLVGSVPALGSWNTADAIAAKSVSGSVWQFTVALPPNTAVQYKFIKKTAAGTVTWESDPNRSYTTPAAGTTATLTTSWR